MVGPVTIDFVISSVEPISPSANLTAGFSRGRIHSEHMYTYEPGGGTGGRGGDVLPVIVCMVYHVTCGMTYGMCGMCGMC